MTEGAIVAPVFFLLLFGVVEFGVVFRDKLSFEAASQRGARMGAIQGDSLGADQEILEDVVHFLEIGDTVYDVQIVVYKAEGPDDLPSADCLAGTPQPGECNVYEPGDELDSDNFGCNGSTLDDAYCPGSRSTRASEQECIGIHLSGYHPFFTGFFGDGMDFTTKTVARIEPQDFGSSGASSEPCGTAP